MKMNFSLSLTGLDTGKRDTEEKSKFVLWKCMNKMEEIAKIMVPVDTGLLKRSINVYPMESGFRNYILADGVDYGIHIEYGTRIKYGKDKNHPSWIPYKKRIYLMRPRPFFRPALHQVQMYWLDVFKNEVFGAP